MLSGTDRTKGISNKSAQEYQVGIWSLIGPQERLQRSVGSALPESHGFSSFRIKPLIEEKVNKKEFEVRNAKLTIRISHFGFWLLQLRSMPRHNLPPGHHATNQLD